MESAGLTRALILPWLTKTRLALSNYSSAIFQQICISIVRYTGRRGRSGLYSPSYVHYVIGVSIFHRMNAAKHSSRNEK
jgi:hypothetical protein